MIEEFLCKST